jgi:glycine betaine/proline transport system substrate-binding protein
MMKRFTKAIRLFGFALPVAVLVGCSPRTASPGTKTAKLVYPNWAEGVAYTHLAKAVLEDKMSYTVELTAADVALGYTAVAQGSHDAFMECWPSLQVDYLQRYGDRLVTLGTVYEGAQVGLAVPAYVTIDRLSQLDDYAPRFGNHITGIDAGAGIMKKIEDELIPRYGLTHITLMASSGPAMTAALADAIAKKKWIVVIAWKPHWMFGRWNLKFLKQDEDKKIWESSSDIEIIGRVDLQKDKPELARFLQNYHFTDAQLADLMVKVHDADDDIMTVVRRWMDRHEDLVDSWIPATDS